MQNVYYSDKYLYNTAFKRASRRAEPISNSWAATVQILHLELGDYSALRNTASTISPLKYQLSPVQGSKMSAC
jgi:hypothetical protein